MGRLSKAQSSQRQRRESEKRSREEQDDQQLGGVANAPVARSTIKR
jgi:hypothetical protein